VSFLGVFIMAMHGHGNLIMTVWSTAPGSLFGLPRCRVPPGEKPLFDFPAPF